MGAPKQRSRPGRYTTEGGITIDCAVRAVSDHDAEFDSLVESIDTHRGLILESSYEFPGRYAHWTMGFTAPPLVLEAWGRSFRVVALNLRGRVLLRPIRAALDAEAAVKSLAQDGEDTLNGEVVTSDHWFAEEERSKQPSIFSVVRCLVALFKCADEPQLGLYGAFGYDLALQFEPIELRADRGADGQRDLVLYLPDKIFVHDIVARDAWVVSYDFSIEELSTTTLARTPSVSTHVPKPVSKARDHAPGEFAQLVERAKEEFRVGNLFEVVCSQRFADSCEAQPSEIFKVLRVRNPSPYGFAINLGASEFLVGASPEMFVRVEPEAAGLRVETCPISGTIRRGADALEDAANIKTILSDPKEESELTMCTDVDRNDKSRICEPGSVKVIGRRQIEMYSRLIHTVDHVEGFLRTGFDALDAFLCHMWAVTVTGAPKLWAMRFVEKCERSHRAWYGGAIGFAGFDGRINTGLTLRTVHIQHGEAAVRAGATLLYDSVPAAEEAETELKASAMRDALREASDAAKAARQAGTKAVAPRAAPPSARAPACSQGFASLSIVLVDHQDSFVHTLANYLKQTGAKVVTVRSGFEYALLDDLRPDLVVLSPGPGNPRDFKCSELLAELTRRGVAVFGVCLGLQAMIEHFGGELAVLPHPQHGKPATVRVTAGAQGSLLFDGLPDAFQVSQAPCRTPSPSAHAGGLYSPQIQGSRARLTRCAAALARVRLRAITRSTATAQSTRTSCA
jgi:anthranilate synthase